MGHVKGLAALKSPERKMCELMGCFAALVMGLYAGLCPAKGPIVAITGPIAGLWPANRPLCAVMGPLGHNLRERPLRGLGGLKCAN